MKPRILTVSSANMDFVMKVGEMPDGGRTVIETRDYSYVPGGKGANAAVALARLGADSVFCAKLFPPVRTMLSFSQKTRSTIPFIWSPMRWMPSRMQ